MAAVMNEVKPSIGKLIDAIHAKREAKRELEEKLKEIEADIESKSEQLMELLDEQGIDASRGTKASCSITKTTVANVTDWEAFHKYIKRTGYFHLLQRRVTDTAYRELLEQGKKVPGTEPFTKRRLNLRSI